MASLPTTDEVRQLVRRVLAQLGATPQELAALEEHLLFQHGRCYARSYRTPRLWATWLLDVELIQFYDHQGRMLRTISLRPPAPARRAA